MLISSFTALWSEKTLDVIPIAMLYLMYLLGQGEQKKKLINGTVLNYKVFAQQRKTINRIKRQGTDRENIFADISDDELISKIYTELIKLNTTEP